jgi:hypothetical protein
MFSLSEFIYILIDLFFIRRVISTQKNQKIGLGEKKTYQLI